MNGKQRTDQLKLATIYYLIKKGYSCINEMGVVPWGRRKCDIIALNNKRHLIIVEVKQSISDFRSDNKWVDYLKFCNKFYFCIPQDLYTKHKDEIIAKIKNCSSEAGIMVLMNGGISVKLNAKNKLMKKKLKYETIVRIAMRGGATRYNTRRRKIYV